jgi:hypothetical protein
VSATSRAVTRRTAIGGLAGTVAAATAGCTPAEVDRRPSPGATTQRGGRADPDVALAATVLRHEQAMLDAVLATARMHPALGATLAGARAAHRAHVQLLTEAVPGERGSGGAGAAAASPSPSGADERAPSPSGTPAGSPSGVPTTTAEAVPPVPVHGDAALASLAGAEQRLSLTARRSSFAAESGAFARVLASMAAAAAQQGVHLAAAVQQRR